MPLCQASPLLSHRQSRCPIQVQDRVLETVIADENVHGTKPTNKSFVQAERYNDTVYMFCPDQANALFVSHTLDLSDKVHFKLC